MYAYQWCTIPIAESEQIPESAQISAGIGIKVYLAETEIGIWVLSFPWIGIGIGIKLYPELCITDAYMKP